MTYIPQITPLRISKEYGFIAGGKDPTDRAYVERYDDINNAWASKSNLGTASTALCGYSLNGYGYSNQGYDASTVEQYNDITDVWTVKQI